VFFARESHDQYASLHTLHTTLQEYSVVTSSSVVNGAIINDACLPFFLSYIPFLHSFLTFLSYIPFYRTTTLQEYSVVTSSSVVNGAVINDGHTLRLAVYPPPIENLVSSSSSSSTSSSSSSSSSFSVQQLTISHVGAPPGIGGPHLRTGGNGGAGGGKTRCNYACMQMRAL
jgi:hypothetical protein